MLAKPEWDVIRRTEALSWLCHINQWSVAQAQDCVARNGVSGAANPGVAMCLGLLSIMAMRLSPMRSKKPATFSGIFPV
ncbi:hypothetical protein D5366_11690 (plasmid) [Neokomagataea tanensis]|uniref:Uncharacterized protein n=1 Tax=Neokomagataea tanensis TaxID=661191 RepID=A0A4Y6V7N3_9PROT|nr:MULTISPECIES: hypothetical protein [Neokomagataea]QDH26069.1 hypothetical protein D5366_11690 [Neokomagataea tanensis]